jgi:hypothetical protein
VKPCNRNAAESFPVPSLESREQKPPNHLLIQDKDVLQPSAGLTLEEHGGIGRRHEVELREHRREGSAVPDDPVDVGLDVEARVASWSCPTSAFSYVAALEPVELVHTRRHTVPPSI